VSVKITHEYVCDICSGKIRETDSYNIHPFVPVEGMHWPTPRIHANVVWDKHVCDPCLQLAIEPLVNRYRELNPFP